MASNGFERRIAGRGPVGPIPVTFRATERSRGLLGGLRSVGGARAGLHRRPVGVGLPGSSCVRSQGLVVKSPVELSHDGQLADRGGEADRARDDGRIMYGVDFTSMDPGMRDFLFSFVEARRPGDLERQWLQATLTRARPRLPGAELAHFFLDFFLPDFFFEPFFLAFLAFFLSDFLLSDFFFLAMSPPNRCLQDERRVDGASSEIGAPTRRPSSSGGAALTATLAGRRLPR